MIAAEPAADTAVVELHSVGVADRRRLAVDRRDLPVGVLERQWRRGDRRAGAEQRK